MPGRSSDGRQFASEIDRFSGDETGKGRKKTVATDARRERRVWNAVLGGHIDLAAAAAVPLDVLTSLALLLFSFLLCTQSPSTFSSRLSPGSDRRQPCPLGLLRDPPFSAFSCTSCTRKHIAILRGPPLSSHRPKGTHRSTVTWTHLDTLELQDDRIIDRTRQETLHRQ